MQTYGIPELEFDKEQKQLREKRRDLLVISGLALLFWVLSAGMFWTGSWWVLFAIIPAVRALLMSIAAFVTWQEIREIHNGRLARLWHSDLYRYAINLPEDAS